MWGGRVEPLSEILLYDAMHRALRAEIPVVLMVTDPKDRQAEEFYCKHGFQQLNAERLFITMRRIAEVLATPDSHR